MGSNIKVWCMIEINIVMNFIFIVYKCSDLKKFERLFDVLFELSLIIVDVFVCLYC